VVFDLTARRAILKLVPTGARGRNMLALPGASRWLNDRLGSVSIHDCGRLVCQAGKQTSVE